MRGFGAAAAVTTTFAYDKARLGVTATTNTTAGDPNTQKSTATYDANGNPITQLGGLNNSFNEPLTRTRAQSVVGRARADHHDLHL